MMEKRAPAKSIIVARAFSPGSSSALESSEELQGVVQSSSQAGRTAPREASLITSKETMPFV
ncbi:hypothetical protein LB504_005508 [Fusarium proliferatum]|nr:hypothetical protein LB504_005508 [Fusarium proliferatum]